MFLFFFVNFCNLIYLITIRRLLRVQKVSTYMTYDIQIQVHQPAPNYKSFLTHTADYKPKAVESTHMKDNASVSRTCYRKSNILFKTATMQLSRRGRPTIITHTHAAQRTSNPACRTATVGWLINVHTTQQFVTTVSAKRAKSPVCDRTQKVIEAGAC